MVNQCAFIGRLGADPKVTALESGNKVAQFSIACDEPGYITKDGRTVEKRTEWVPVVLWRGLAEVAEKYLKKGSLVYIAGKFRTRSYEDANKNVLYRTEIYADEMKMLDTKKESVPLPPEPDAAPAKAPAQAATQAPKQSDPNMFAANAPEAEGDDLPF